jgi:hypothetical protein
VRTLGPRSPPRRLGHSTQEETSPKEPPSARYCECTRPGWAREVAGPAYPMWPTERAVRPMNRAATTATVGRQPHDARPTALRGRIGPAQGLGPNSTEEQAHVVPHTPPIGPVQPANLTADTLLQWTRRPIHRRSHG